MYYNKTKSNRLGIKMSNIYLLPKCPSCGKKMKVSKLTGIYYCHNYYCNFQRLDEDEDDRIIL